MRHGRQKRRLGLVYEHRRALLRNLARGLITKQQIVTTHARAKETSRFVDSLVTIAKQNSLHARRHLIQELGSGSEELAGRMISTIAPKFSSRKGGYTRVLHYRIRSGDGAPLSLLEFTVPVVEPRPKKPKKAKKDKPDVKEESMPDATKAERPSEKKEAKKVEAETPRKETPKKGGFLGSLRRCLKGDDEK